MRFSWVVNLIWQYSYILSQRTHLDMLQKCPVPRHLLSDAIPHLFDPMNDQIFHPSKLAEYYHWWRMQFCFSMALSSCYLPAFQWCCQYFSGIPKQVPEFRCYRLLSLFACFILNKIGMLLVHRKPGIWHLYRHLSHCHALFSSCLELAI